MKSFFYHHLKGSLNFHELFVKWHEILKWYEDEASIDLPYWYTERTNIGHLALATYQLSGRPLQEFSCKKGSAAKNSQGRADLYIEIPDFKLNGKRIRLEANIEAKQIGCSLRLRDGSKETIKDGLARAIKDCDRLQDEDWRTSNVMALLFVLPYEAKIYRREEMQNNIQAFTKSIVDYASTLKANFVAQHYAGLDLSSKVYRKFPKYSWHPGIVVIGKMIV